MLADLRYPAEARKTACRDVQNKDGQISIKDLKTILDTQAAVGSQTQVQVPAEHARALVESIIVRKGSASQNAQTSEGSFKSSVQIKTEGSYSLDEFRGLLEKVLQEADTTPVKFGNQEQGTQSGTAETVKTTYVPKMGQTESLASTVLPSFIFADRQNDTTAKIPTANSNNLKIEAQIVKATDARENSTETVSDNLKTDEQLIAAKVGSEGTDRITQGMQTGIKDGTSGISPGSTSSVPSSRQQTASIPVESLDPILKYFDAKIVSAAPQQAETKSAETPAPGGPHDGLAAQVQNLAPQVKGVEKQADGPRGTSNSSKLPEDIGEQTETVLIRTASAEYPSSEWSLDSNSNQTADSSPKTQAQATPAKFDPEEIRAQLQEVIKNRTAPAAVVETSGKVVEDATPLAQSISEKPTDFIGGLKDGAGLTAAVSSANPSGKASAPAAGDETSGKVVEDAAKFAQSISEKPTDSIGGLKDGAGLTAAVSSANPSEKASAPAASINTAGTPEQLLKSPGNVEEAAKGTSGVVSQIPVQAGGKTTGQSQLLQAVSGFDLPTENLHSRADLSVSGEGTDPGISVQESAPATTGTGPVQFVESHTAPGGQETAILAKQVEKQSGDSDSALGSQVFQNSASNLQSNQISTAPTDNSAQNGFAGYDPYRSAELVQEMREQFAGGPTNQLVLEMDQDGLGKINIKVEARKEEISVAALTQSEPAKQALMEHSAALRRDLQDQGLVLEKFMVDVNGEKSSGRNYPDTSQTAGGKTSAPPPRVAKVSSTQTADTPVYIPKTADRPQINIFA